MGTDKPVVVTGITLGGVDADNYILTDTSRRRRRQRSRPSPSSADITAESKQYDETDAAIIATRTLEGTLPGDDVAYVGGIGQLRHHPRRHEHPRFGGGLSLAGADATNYTVNSTATTYADITFRT